jgi:hypothetical protein
MSKSQEPIKQCLGSYRGSIECSECPTVAVCKSITEGLQDDIERTGRHIRLQGKYKDKRGWKLKDKY